jgi:hypothetical protein
MLAKLLREDPSEELIDAVSSIADEECLVQLGRIARTEPALSDAALNALLVVTAGDAGVFNPSFVGGAIFSAGAGPGR